jgi:hypothetical protein
VKLDQVAPNLDMMLWRPVLTEPPLCSFRELCDGTYSLDDLYDFHEALDLKDHLKKELQDGHSA